MGNTLLHYLTLRNPNIIQRGLSGKGTETRKIYGPDKREPWADMTLENLQMAFGEVLSKEMSLPEPRDASKIPASKRKIYTETSVRKLAVVWNEHVVQHALDGANGVLRQAKYGDPLAVGRVQFTDNDGRGDLKDEDGRWHYPDWIAYREREGDNKIPSPVSGNRKHTIPNLLPGECKPSMKWKSQWLYCSDQSLKMKAEWVLRQVTKYMHLAKTRYSFILSDEELVPVRLSTYTRDPAAEVEQLNEAQKENIVDLSVSFEEEEEGGEEGASAQFSRVPLERDPDGSFADESREIGYVLEWCSIPWENMGHDALTINLALWWLCVLATQGTSVKGYGTYTPLGEMNRGDSPDPFVHTTQSEADGEGRERKPAKTGKRGAEGHSDTDYPAKRLRTRRPPFHRDDKTPPTSSAARSSTTRTASQRMQSRTTIESQASTSLTQDMPSPSLGRSKGPTAAAHTSTDDDSDSETTNEYDGDPILLSFAPG